MTRSKEQKSPFNDYVNYYNTAQNVTNTNCLSGPSGNSGEPGRLDKESNMKEYQRRLLKSIEKRTSRMSDYVGSAMEPASIQADDLKKQRILNKNTAYKSPNKRDKSPIIEKYQDFTVKFGIVHPIQSDLVQSPNADKSKILNFSNIIQSELFKLRKRHLTIYLEIVILIQTLKYLT